MNIAIHPVSDADFSVVSNLVTLYIYDMSEHMGWACPNSGLFIGVTDLCRYWDKTLTNPTKEWPDHWSGFGFIVRVNDELAGFVMIRQTSYTLPCFEIGEFFVLRKFRHQGVGTLLATTMFDRFRGRWIIRQFAELQSVSSFWGKVLSNYANDDARVSEELSADGKQCFRVYEFTNSEGRMRASDING
jgi:predicted acetyltransferase